MENDYRCGVPGCPCEFFVPSLVHPSIKEIKLNELNTVQKQHRSEVVSNAVTLIHDKYTAGALEHQTNLKQDTTLAQLLEFAIEEAVDQMVYLITMKQKLDSSEEW